MKVPVAGATGVMGRQLVPLLAAARHDVVGMTRSNSKRDLLGDLGATPVLADALDPSPRSSSTSSPPRRARWTCATSIVTSRRPTA
jgi:nucleoside-diphosphate-sugar epimerase